VKSEGGINAAPEEKNLPASESQAGRVLSRKTSKGPHRGGFFYFWRQTAFGLKQSKTDSRFCLPVLT